MNSDKKLLTRPKPIRVKYGYRYEIEVIEKTEKGSKALETFEVEIKPNNWIGLTALTVGAVSLLIQLAIWLTS